MITIKPHEQLIMLITYHTPEINQASIKKNLNNLGFSSKDLQTDHIRSYESYTSRCTPFEQDIAAIFLRYRNASGIYLSNQYLATLVGCSRRTVTRTTNKFHKDGFITKHQPNKYSSNHYTLHEKIKTGSTVFMHRFNSLSEEQQDIYITHGIIVDHKNKKICSDVTPNKNSLLLDSLSSNRYPFARTCVRVKGYKKQSEKYKKGVSLVNEFQKKWIINHKTDPRVKDMLNNPRIKTTLITPTIEKITELLVLTEDEQLKLVVFDDKSLDYALASITPIVLGKKPLSKNVEDRMGWLMSMLIGYSKDHNISPDWKWYYDVCEIIGKDPKQVQPKKPLIIAKPKVISTIYKPWKRPKELPVDEQVNALKSDIKKLSEQIKFTDGPSYMTQYARSVIERKIKTLELLEGHHEFASILH